MNLRRIALVSVAAPALALGGPAMAMADTFEQSHSSAGPNGAQSHSVSANSGSGSGGGASYEEDHQWAGPDGAGSSSTSSNSGGNSSGLLGLGIIGL